MRLIVGFLFAAVATVLGVGGLVYAAFGWVGLAAIVAGAIATGTAWKILGSASEALDDIVGHDLR